MTLVFLPDIFGMIKIYYTLECSTRVDSGLTQKYQTRGQCYQTFYGRNLRNFVISWNVCPGKPFQPSVMFVGKARAYPSDVTFSCCTLGWAPGITHKYQTRLERLTRDKCFSLLRKFVHYGRKKFYNIGPRLNSLTEINTLPYYGRVYSIKPFSSSLNLLQKARAFVLDNFKDSLVFITKARILPIV